MNGSSVIIPCAPIFNDLAEDFSSLHTHVSVKIPLRRRCHAIGMLIKFIILRAPNANLTFHF